jgi:hypothetical protein
MQMLVMPINSQYLDSQGGDDGLSVDQGRVAKVVEATLLEDLGTSLEPNGLLRKHSGNNQFDLLGKQYHTIAAAWMM